MLSNFGKAVRLLLTGCLLLGTTTQVTFAGVITTEASYRAAQHAATLSRVQSTLARDDVRQQLVAWGVDPELAAERVSALTPGELADLDARLQELPAGGIGVFGVLGITAFVLIILEVLGVTNVFTNL